MTDLGAPAMPWPRHSPACTHYLVDGVCTCEVVLLILDSDSLPDAR